jgi:endoglucanase
MTTAFREGIDRRRFIAGAGALTLTAPLAARRAMAGSADRIEIVGNRFHYAGAPLRLTGIAVGDPLYIRANRLRSDYQTLARDWRANCVRISMQPGLWREDPEGAAAALKSDVSYARDAGLFVIIDWHRVGFPGHYDPVVPEDWGLPTDVALATIEETAAFWRTMAETYADDPAILFEIWNEPSADEHLWEATGEHWPLFKAAWEEIIAEIRPLADNIVLCAGGYWAHDLVGVRDNLIDDPRVAYTWHAYPNAERGDLEARVRTLGGLQDVKPIVVTEWGFSPDDEGDLNGTVADFGEPFAYGILDAFGLSYTAWCYSTGAMPNLLASEDGTPSASGVFVKELLQRDAEKPDWRLASDA